MFACVCSGAARLMSACVLIAFVATLRDSGVDRARRRCLALDAGFLAAAGGAASAAAPREAPEVVAVGIE